MPVHDIALALVAIILAVACVRVIGIYFRYSGGLAVTCPENHNPAGVAVNRPRAALSGLLSAPSLRLTACSRWPERSGCGQACLSQIEASPENCLVRDIAAKWYEGKVCASCKLPFHEIQWQIAKPALFLADKTAMEWNRVPPERLQEILASAEPLCCSCYLAARIAIERPDLATERPRSWTRS